MLCLLNFEAFWWSRLKNSALVQYSTLYKAEKDTRTQTLSSHFRIIPLYNNYIFSTLQHIHRRVRTFSKDWMSKRDHRSRIQMSMSICSKRIQYSCWNYRCHSKHSNSFFSWKCKLKFLTKSAFTSNENSRL